MTSVYLIRHGETDWNVHGRVQGRLDTLLNARGRAQAADLRDRLGSVPFTGAVTSPLARAHDTARTVLAGAPIALRVDLSLAEIDYGRWTGTTAAERWRDQPRMAAAWERSPVGVHFPEGESFAVFRRRVLAGWRSILRAHEGGTLLVCAHGHVNRVILLDLLRWRPERFWDLAQPNAECVRATL